MKRFLTSVLTLGLVIAAVVTASNAFFSDTETSTGNILQAGDIDLKIGNTSYYNGAVSNTTTWTLADLTVEKFFNFADLKPGDWGEDTIQMSVTSNEAYACANVQITENSENGLTEPETDLNDNDDSGELANELEFAFWVDDGDNVYESGVDTIITEGPAANVFNGGTLALQDANAKRFETTGGLLPDTDYFIGKAWCFGELVLPDYTDDTTDPTARPVECNGELVSNLSQTDRLVGDISFYAVQTRNNEQFTCSDDLFPTPTVLPTAEVVEDTGSSDVDLDSNGGGQGKEWFAKARNNNANFEIAVGTNDALPAGQDTAETTWLANTEYPFTLSYDGSGNASFTANGETVNFAVGTTDYERIGVNVKAPTGETTTVDNLVLSVAGALSNDDVSVTNGTNHLLVTGVDLNQAWNLTGTFVFSAVGGGSQENPAVQISVD